MQYASSTNLGFIETVLAESRPRTLQDMALFVEIARDRSFTRASKASGMPIATLSRHVATRSENHSFSKLYVERSYATSRCVVVVSTLKNQQAPRRLESDERSAYGVDSATLRRRRDLTSTSC
jgi:hypothetical protein